MRKNSQRVFRILRPINKRGQMKLSFGMIFSIILIVVFLTFAFLAIKKFMVIGNTAQIAEFKNSLQADIDKVWRGSQGSQTEEYFLPSKIKYLCFIDYNVRKSGAHQDFYNDLNQAYFGSENFVFYPVGSAEGLDSAEIKHIDLEKIIEEDNPFCIKNMGGKVKITLRKNYGDALVTITD